MSTEKQEQGAMEDVLREYERDLEDMEKRCLWHPTDAYLRRLLERVRGAWKHERRAWGLERVEIATRAATQAVKLTNEKIASSPVGNSLAMREALEMARVALKSAEKYVYGDPPNGGAIGWDDVWPSEWHNALEAVERALSAPPRNCDVYDPDKAAHMMEVDYCGSMPPSHCDGTNCTGCSFKWFTSPAEKGGAK